MIETSPRRLPWGVRARVVINAGTLIGSLLLGVGTALAMADDPFGHLVLAFGLRQAPGQTTAVEPTLWVKTNRPIYRCRYSYRTADGVTRRGVGFLERDPGRAVVVEYSPAIPGISGIQGALPGLCPLGPAFGMGVVGLTGLAILAGGLLYAWGTLRLLRLGEIAQAQLVSCIFTSRRENGEEDSEVVQELPFEKFRRTWLAKTDTRPGPKKPVGGFLRFWMACVLIIGGLGVVFQVVILALSVLGNTPARFNGQPVSREVGLAIGLGFLAAWLLVFAAMYWFGRLAVATQSGPTLTGLDRPPSRVTCKFEFALPDGRVIRSSDSVKFDEDFGSGPSETVLFDPARPERAILLHSLGPDVRPDAFGEWESTGNWIPWLRLIAVAVVIAGASALFA